MAWTWMSYPQNAGLHLQTNRQDTKHLVPICRRRQQRCRNGTSSSSVLCGINSFTCSSYLQPEGENMFQQRPFYGEQMRRLLRPISHGAKSFRCYTSGSGMEASAGTGMYPLHRCKTIYLVRHAQGIHNAEGDKDPNAYMSPALFDAHLTPLGWKQVECLRDHVKKCGLTERIELVISSPLLRTMQTAVGVFGGENNIDSISAAPLMVENAGHSEHPAISSLNCPPFLAVEACRERSGLYPSERRRSKTEYQTLFPAIDFSLIENDEDALWTPDVRESKEAVVARAMKFIDWLWTRKEKQIAIVSHGGFLFHTLNMYSKECHPTIQEEMVKVFENCELRSMMLVDRSMLGSESSSWNYPGGWSGRRRP